MRFCQSLGFTCGLDTNVRGRLSKTSGFWPLLFVFGLLLVDFCTMDPLQRVSWRLGFICGLGTNFGKLVKKL